ncbi:hypothetical protein J2P12_07220 [Candidatus Bathyarchaeota archaeon]|nr:hypothetical protein [Candidatus Bathyarchaeota archaeon]
MANALDEIARICPEAVIAGRGKLTPAFSIVSALEQFQDCIRYLNTRRSKGAVIDINGEDDVQDVVFLMLRPLVQDLVPENPTDLTASRYVIQDFLSKNLKTVVEAKFVRDKKHGKEITKELHDDIEMYRNHPECREIVFFIYDPESLIPDLDGLRRQIAGTRKYDGKTVQVHCVIKP